MAEFLHQHRYFQLWEDLQRALEAHMKPITKSFVIEGCTIVLVDLRVMSFAYENKLSPFSSWKERQNSIRRKNQLSQVQECIKSQETYMVLYGVDKNNNKIIGFVNTKKCMESTLKKMLNTWLFNMFPAYGPTFSRLPRFASWQQLWQFLIPSSLMEIWNKRVMLK